MEGIFQWGIDFVVAVQNFRTPFLDAFFLSITKLGDDLFYFLVFALLYWCVDERETARFTVLFCLAYWVNSELKRFLAQPRPYNYLPEVNIGYSSGGGGLPSYHAQGSFVFWIYIARWFKKPVLYWMSAALIVIIAFSRIYLGRHFPTDILGGWLLGLILLIIFYLSYKGIEDFFNGRGLYLKIGASLLIPFLLALIKPSSWTVSAMGVLSGFSFGYVIMREFFSFSAQGDYWRKICRYTLGIIVLAVLNYGFKALFPEKGNSLFIMFVYLRFWMMGFWISAGSVWLFRKFGLAGEPPLSQ